MATQSQGRKLLRPGEQAARAVLMVRPTYFRGNPQTAATNELQSVTVAGDVAAFACREFDEVEAALARTGVEVVVFDPVPGTPDAVFPNNWISTHADRTVVLYPMLAPNRRLERQPALVSALSGHYGFEVEGVIDLTLLEESGGFIEGTGSLVLDHIHHVAYVGLSARSTPRGIREACRVLGYEPCIFTATHASGAAIYHTNVMLSVGRELAIGCFESIRDEAQRRRVLEKLESTGKRLLPLGEEQMLRFAANVLELKGTGGPVLAISARAWGSLDPSQRCTIEKHAAPCIAAVDTLERVGGGGIRCMLAEIHLPKL